MSRKEWKASPPEDADTLVPREIQRMDDKAIEIFSSALMRGKFQSYHIRIMFIGHSGAGKSTLAWGILPDSTKVPLGLMTDGIEIFIDQCFYDRALQKWKSNVPGFKSFSASVLLADDTIDEIRRHNTSIGSTEDESSKGPSTVVLKRGSNRLSSMFKSIKSKFISTETEVRGGNNPHKKSHKDLIKRVTESYDDHLVRADEIVPVDIWDFGGHSVFYTTHQAFLTERSIYILPVDLSLPFEHRLTDSMLDPSEPEMSSIRAFLSFWISSITTYVKGKKSGYPKIIIVGTHLDKIPEDQRGIIIQRALAFIKGNYKDEVTSSQLVIDEYLCLDARNKLDPAYNVLREKIIDVAEGQVEWGEELPKSWLPLQEEILNEKKKGRKILTTDEIREMNDKCITPVSEEEICVILQYLHSIGLVLYFNDPGLYRHVILEPKWVIDILKSFITDRVFCRSDKVQTWEKMSKDGIIEDSEIDRLWNQPEFQLFGQNKKYLLKVLTNLDLIAKPKSYDKEGKVESLSFYYVPSMLKEIAPSELNSSLLNGVDISFRFSKILSLAVYNRLTAACLKMWTVKDNGLFFGFSIFKVDIDHDLVLRKDEETICVHVSNRRGVKANTNVCFGIQTFVESELVRIVNLYQNMNAPEDIESSKIFTVKGVQLTENEYTDDEQNCPKTCKGPLEKELDKLPTDFELSRLSRMLPYECFRAVGVYLNISDRERTDILNHRTYRADQYFEIFRLWKHKKGNKSTLRCLIQALSEIEDISHPEHLICKIHSTSAFIDEDELPSAIKNKIPSDKVLEGFAIAMCKEYRQVAMEIGVDYHKLTEIEENNKNDIVTRIRKMLLIWKETSKTVRPSAEILTKALKVNGCEYIRFCNMMKADT